MATSPTDLDIINQEVPDPESNVLPQEVIDVIEVIKNQLDLEERNVRQLLIKEWKRFELAWRGIQNIFWSEKANDWKTFDDLSLDKNDIPPGLDPDQYNQIVNIFRAHGESIIAALTVSVPAIRCYPEDADKIEDIIAAKGFTKLSDKIDNDIDAPLKLVQILFNLYCFGIAFGYNYHETDEKYGTEKEPQFGLVEKENPVSQCPDCESMAGPEMVGSPCPSCMEMSDPSVPPPQMQASTQTSSDMEEIREIVLPKSQECIEIFGPLHVKVPHNLTDLRNAPYLCLEMEHHYTILREMYPDKASEINGNTNLSESDRWARNPLESGSTVPNMCTYSRWWLRPSAYNILEAGDEKLQLIKQQFPDGLLAIFVDNVFMEARAENLDDHWTVTTSPLSLTLNAPALGAGVMPIQEMRNELDALTMRSIKNGIPETFVDPSVVDLDAYNATPAEPGLVFGAKPRPGQKLGDAFFTNTPTTLSRDVPAYREQLDADAQFVSGAYPSVYGGPNTGGSKTASEYDQSRNQALQRLSLAWKMLNIFWAAVKKRAMLEYRQNITKDQNFVKYSGGSFVNVWIKQEELSGSIGRVETETSDQFPLSWIQLRGLMLQLLQMNNQNINAMLFDPANIGEMSKTIGWTDMKIPGENDRNKQLAEIGEMVKGQYVQVDPMLDNSAVHVEVIKDYLCGAKGMDLQQNNPEAYAMIHQHLQEHMMIINPPAPTGQMMPSPPMDPGQGQPAPVQNVPPNGEQQNG
jgi:hypothetical protein